MNNNHNPEGKHHDLKCIQPYFDQVKSGAKTFDVRLNDRDFKAGDTVTLHEYKVADDYIDGEYLVQKLDFVISYVLDNYPALKEGYVVFGLSQPSIPEAELSTQLLEEINIFIGGNEIHTPIVVCRIMDIFRPHLAKPTISKTERVEQEGEIPTDEQIKGAATIYLGKQTVDYGDLNEKAESQILKAYIDSATLYRNKFLKQQGDKELAISKKEHAFRFHSWMLEWGSTQENIGKTYDEMWYEYIKQPGK